MQICLHYDDAANRGELTIADNGLGMSAEAKPGFGLQAISMLLRQVQGTMEQRSSGQRNGLPHRI